MPNSADAGARATEDDPTGTGGADQAPHKTNQIALGAGIAVFLGMALFWAAIFSGAFTTRNPDKLHDATWAPAAARVCKPAATTIKNLPNASTSKSADDRADLNDQGTAALEPMVAGLEALPSPGRASDRTVVNGYLEDWRVYLQDRRNFSDALRKDPKAKPLFTETHGGWDTDAIDAMANANDIPDCATPGDM
jgi:hypothetical protein